MKSKRILINTIKVSMLAVFMSGCTLFDMELQKKYDYEKKVLDPHINMTAREFLEKRSYGVDPADTIFKWMRMGLEYAEIDLAEYEKPGRTYILLHNDAIRTYTGSGSSRSITAGFWFDYPLVTSVDPNTGQPITALPTKWEDYPKEDVKNYFLYLIALGDYNFDKLGANNTTAQTLLPPNTVASTQTRLGYVNNGFGFDQEGKMNFRLVNNDDMAPIRINDKTNNRSGGYVATNGIVHVYGTTVHPFR